MTGVGSVVGGRIHRYMMINYIVICVFISCTLTFLLRDVEGYSILTS